MRSTLLWYVGVLGIWWVAIPLTLLVAALAKPPFAAILVAVAVVHTSGFVVAGYVLGRWGGPRAQAHAVAVGPVWAGFMYLLKAVMYAIGGPPGNLPPGFTNPLEVVVVIGLLVAASVGALGGSRLGMAYGTPGERQDG